MTNPVSAFMKRIDDRFASQQAEIDFLKARVAQWEKAFEVDQPPSTTFSPDAFIAPLPMGAKPPVGGGSGGPGVPWMPNSVPSVDTDQTQLTHRRGLRVTV